MLRSHHGSNIEVWTGLMRRFAAVFLPLIMPVLACGCSISSGACPNSIRVALSAVPTAKPFAVTEIQSALRQRGDQIISVDIDPEWDTVSIRVRRRDGASITCTNTRLIGNQLERNTEYQVYSRSASAMFGSIYLLASRGYRYTAPQWREYSNARSEFLITTGVRPAVGWNQGGTYSEVVCEMCQFAEELKLKSGEINLATAHSCFGDDVLASEATLVTLAVCVFDTLCQAAFATEQSTSSPAG
jgi:hypothetical protein